MPNDATFCVQSPFNCFAIHPHHAKRGKVQNKNKGVATMTTEQRNTIFKDYMRIIRYTVNRHHSMLKILRMDSEDLAQELAICLLKAIERYDDTRGAKPSTYYFKSLRYGVLQLWREQMREIRLANIQAMPLAYADEHGEES